MMNVIQFWILSITFLLIPPGAVDTLRRGRGRRNGTRRGSYDSDFNEFMFKIFKSNPQKTNLDEVKKGPNVGHRPYWADHASNDKAKDYGLDNSGDEVWRLPGKTLMGDYDILGARTVVDADAPKEHNRNCYKNMGPTCKLGEDPNSIGPEKMREYENRTRHCDNLCTTEKRKKGLVCVREEKEQVLQEMHYCVFEKMNCLEGIAVVHTDGRGYSYDWRKVPFALKPYWGRISIMGTRAHLYFSNYWPYNYRYYYWFILSSGFDLHDELWCQNRWGIQCWYFATAFTGYPYSLKEREWREYTFVWSGGHFLMSQPRKPYTWDQWWMQRWMNPVWNILYIDVSSVKGYFPKFILHDLVLIKYGGCRLEPLYLPMGTKETLDKADKLDKEYWKRISDAKIHPDHLAAEMGSYNEY